MHKKEEALCNKTDNIYGLARTWWGQGLIYNKKGNFREQEYLWRKSIDLDKSMGIPAEKNEEALKQLLESIGK